MTSGTGSQGRSFQDLCVCVVALSGGHFIGAGGLDRENAVRGRVSEQDCP